MYRRVLLRSFTIFCESLVCRCASSLFNVYMHSFFILLSFLWHHPKRCARIMERFMCSVLFFESPSPVHLYLLALMERIQNHPLLLHCFFFARTIDRSILFLPHFSTSFIIENLLYSSKTSTKYAHSVQSADIDGTILHSFCVNIFSWLSLSLCPFFYQRVFIYTFRIHVFIHSGETTRLESQPVHFTFLE